MELKIRKTLGIITTASAIGILIINYLSHRGLDSFIMPFILLCFSVIMLFGKQTKEAAPMKLNKKHRKIILSIVSITLVSGIVVFLITVI